ncbi:Acetamidase [Hyphodiscus hymeniophilus]|uniref:amidase n=1 Tax=Hyphodiscus hymeniophilus TaxID=353542 RepID=A0A9P6VQF0_9HELO|nr:Acetamidase [Hyphodiscus hymeniophilus]
MGQNYKEIAKVALKRREDAIPKDLLLPESALANLPRNLTTVPKSSGHFTPKELEIMETTAEDILEKIKNKIWSSLVVTKAFIKAAVVAQQLTNCLTEILIPEALAKAKELDEYLEKTGKVVGPFHGLPISLKDCLITPPHPASIGMACFANEATRAGDETILVSILAKLGAVFYVKTTTPTAMMMMEASQSWSTFPNVWGETNGAYHSGTSPGGSSGGEGALLAMRGSPLGIGTDIGGSVRIPSAFNYLYGLKPTFGRFPVYGAKSGITGQDFIYSNNGPMSRSLETLKLYCAAVLSTEVSPWTMDPKCIPVPWRGDVIVPKGRKLRFGIISDNDGEISVHPPIVRGLAMTKNALEAAGHDVFEWKPTDHAEINRELNSAFFVLGGAAIIGLTRKHDEPVFPSMKEYETTYEKGEEGTLGPSKLREMIAKRNALQKAYFDRWSATATDGKGAMDGIILASSPWTAPRLGISQQAFCVSYTGVYNLLGKALPPCFLRIELTSSDYPALTFPVTFASKNLDPKRASWKPLNGKDAEIQADYDPEFYDGTPVALQLVGRRLEDEKVLEMGGIIAEALKAQL